MKTSLPEKKVEPTKQPSQSVIRGRVERLDKNNCISGWAEYLSDVDKKVDIDVYDGDTYLDTIYADKSDETTGSQSKHGFCHFLYQVPDTYLTGELRSIKFMSRENKKALAGSPFRLGNGSFDTEFQVKENQCLKGRVKQRTSSKAVYSINLLLDKKVFWTQEFKGGKNHKVKAKLPKHLFDGQPHPVQIKICDDKGKTLLVTARVVKQNLPQVDEKIIAKPINNAGQSTIKGRVEKRDDNNYIIGWAQDTRDISQAVEIDVYEGDVFLDTIRADKDTSAIGTQRHYGFCGFQFPIPTSYLKGKNRVIKFVDRKSKKNLPGSPFRLGSGFFDSNFTIQNGVLLDGIIQQRTSDKSPYSVNVAVDKEIFWTQKFKGGKSRQIKVKLPHSVFDSQPHSVHIKVCNEQGKTLSMTARQVKHAYQGQVESIGFESIEGWLFNQSYPKLPVDIDIEINGKERVSTQCNLHRFDVQSKHNLDSSTVGFKVDLPDSIRYEASTSIDIFIKGTDNRILSTKYILTPKDIIIRSLMSASEHLNSLEENDKKIALSAGLEVNVTANTLVRKQILAPIIKQLREQEGVSKGINLAINPISQAPAFKLSPIVDVIVPVYKGYDETVACINSVLSTKNKTPSQLIVINDLSPDGRLAFKLQAMSKEGLFTLIENPKNLGFVATANIGLGLHKDRHAVLLNSDTEVYGNWLDRLVNAANKDNNIATVTPFSNNATICSFPEFNQDNQINSDVSAKKLDDLFSKLNHEKSVDLPTAVGFCMLIKREVLEGIGYLDEKRWGKGYGEENDFCLRASTQGWRHVLATDVFVQHHGSVSFSDIKDEWLEKNLSILNKLYPDYPATVERFIKQDPIAKYRNPVIKKLILQKSNKHILFVMHSLGGGTKKNTDQMAESLTQQGYAVLELISKTQTQWELKDHTGKLSLKYTYPEDSKILESDLKELGVWRVHFHQTLNFPKQIWKLPETLSCAYDYTAHDFLPLCPRINMIDESGRYCEESQYDEAKCQRCIQLNGLPEGHHIEDLWNQHNQSIRQWRKQYKQRLQAADNIFCPSESTKKIFKKHYALKNSKVKAHSENSFIIQKPKAETDHGLINIAIIGAIGDHKGSQLLLDCAIHALKEGLPLRFVLIGFSNIDDQLKKLDNVVITGAYKKPEQLTELIKKNECQIALFLSIWPETFCYTLTEALQNNLYPVALGYGAIEERLKKLKYGKILAKDIQAKGINKKLISVASKMDKVKDKVKYQGIKYPSLIKDYYHLDV
jgi:GT2 family glycosyltransferase